MKKCMLLGILFLIFAGCENEQQIPQLKSHVNDTADVIPDDQEQRIRAMLKAHEDETSDQIVILTVESMGGKDIDSYAVEVFEQWKLGTAEKDNGVLIVQAVEERKLRIEVGHGFEGVLTDAVASQIRRNVMTPKFKEDQFGDGHEAGATAVIQAIKGQFVAPPEPAADTTGFWIIIGIIAAIIILGLIIQTRDGPLLIVILDAMANSSGSGGGGGGSGGGGGGGWGGGGGTSGGGGSSGGY